MGRRSHDRGEGAIGYLAVVLLVAAVMAAVLTGDVGGHVAHACAAAICKVAGGDCPSVADGSPHSAASAAPSASPLPPRPPIAKRICEPGPKVEWTEGLHAHNDYDNQRPLYDSLSYGATSVEADVWLDRRGELLVKHTRDVRPPKGTLRDLYVKPLIERAERNGGQIYRGREQPFQLLIEIKDGGAAAYERVLEEIKDLPPSVNVIFDAGRPDSVVGTQPPGVSFDISPGEDCTLPPEVDPESPRYDRAYAANFTMLNGSYGACVDRDHDGEISESEQRRLNAIVQQAHDAGLKVRIVEGPDGAKRIPGDSGAFVPCLPLPWKQACETGPQERSWRAQIEAGMDFVDTNHIRPGAAMLRGCGER
jgi:hypothetical protein